MDACTPFVYVPRPLFIEEHGLRLFLEREGVGIELSRAQYEQGEWADAIEAAWRAGRAAKMRKRAEGDTGRRKEEGARMAKEVVEWVESWKDGVAQVARGTANASAAEKVPALGKLVLDSAVGRVKSSDGMGVLN